MNKKTVKRLMSYILKYKVRFILVFVCIIISSLANVSASLYIGTLIDDYITPLLIEDNPAFDGMIKAVITMAVILLIGVIATFLYNRLMVNISQSVLKKIRDDMFEHMQTLPVKYFDTHSNGDVMSYYTNDADSLRQAISQSIPQMVSSLFTIVSVFFAMIVSSIWLSVFVLIFVFCVLQITKKVAGKSGKYFFKQQKAIADLDGFIEEMINGQKVVKVFNHENKSKEDFDKKNEELFNDAYNANKFANILMPIMNNMGFLLYVLVAIVGGALAIMGIRNISLTGTGMLSLGAIATFLQLSRSFVNPIGQISQQVNMVIMSLAGAERIFTLLDEESEVDNGYVTLVNAEIVNGNIVETDKRTGKWAWKHPHGDGTITYTELKGEVTLDGVDFGYNEEKMVLHDVSVFAKEGQKVAFVGATGAGKTTITNLINRFYDISDGKIRYDDININKIKKADLRHSLGIVLQDTNLFTGTIMENIRYGRLDATDEECINAAKLANAHNFISMLPNGYETVISGNGNDLSQGQRQLLSIARAAVADPPVMILDEATSSIDTRTEAIVQKGMDALMKGRTVFVIAHRLSTVKNSDVIMVLENGRIIERGNHEKLIADRKKYYQLYTGAFELD
ncbi:MAG: ABC transporter ATP-binding protein [Lachnospiraceae bacterium]|nr:ABC transporter ATP-binding protein [Lachnospiraceae bacterium]